MTETIDMAAPRYKLETFADIADLPEDVRARLIPELPTMFDIMAKTRAEITAYNADKPWYRRRVLRGSITWVDDGDRLTRITVARPNGQVVSDETARYAEKP